MKILWFGLNVLIKEEERGRGESGRVRALETDRLVFHSISGSPLSSFVATGKALNIFLALLSLYVKMDLISTTPSLF